MPSVPAPADPGRDGDPAWPDRDPVSPEKQQAWLDWLCEQDDDPADDPQEYWDPESGAPPPGQDELTAAELVEVREAAADEMLALDAASTGRRGPGMAGSGRVFPGESASRAAGFGAGMAWDVMPGCAQLAVAADAAVEGGDRPEGSFGGVADQELIGLVCAWDRVEAHAAARKLVAVAEVFRRNPEDGFESPPGQMPAVVHEFTRDQLALALGESRYQADWLLMVAWHLGTRLDGHAGCAGRRDHHPGQGRDHRPGHLNPGARRSGGGRGQGAGPGRAADPGRAALGHRPGGDRGRARDGAAAAGDRGPVRAGGAVGRGLGERGADGAGAAPG